MLTSQTAIFRADRLPSWRWFPAYPKLPQSKLNRTKGTKNQTMHLQSAIETSTNLGAVLLASALISEPTFAQAHQTYNLNTRKLTILQGNQIANGISLDSRPWRDVLHQWHSFENQYVLEVDSYYSFEAKSLSWVFQNLMSRLPYNWARLQ